jgi:hypothetical protein
MNIVTIDPSLSCTAVIVNNKRFAFVNRTIAFTKRDANKKWFELASDHVSYTYVDYTDLNDYSSNEVNKLHTYDAITTEIMDVIMTNIHTNMEMKVFIEGYSFSSSAGPLIDLVTFSTLLRKKLYDVTEIIDILAPTTLKLEAAKLTYPAIPKGKKVIKYEYRNNEGVSGGSFNKHAMYKALIDNNNLQDEYVQFLRIHQEEILNYKTIPKPIEDVNDAQLMFYIAQQR